MRASSGGSNRRSLHEIQGEVAFELLLAMAILGLGAVCVGRLAAQGATASILGIITDASGAAVSEAGVEAKTRERAWRSRW
jgi:hypothetical protein